jgi:hypothetical protein
MKKSQIEIVRIDITPQGQSALSMLLHKDGTINRQGNGDLPPVKIAAVGMTDGAQFRTLIEKIDPDLMQESLQYKHPQPSGMPITYKIAFLGKQPLMRQYVLDFGLDNDDVHQLVKYFDHFIKLAKTSTDEFYSKAMSDDTSSGIDKKKPWWKL